MEPEKREQALRTLLLEKPEQQIDEPSYDKKPMSKLDVALEKFASKHEVKPVEQPKPEKVVLQHVELDASEKTPLQQRLEQYLKDKEANKAVEQNLTIDQVMDVEVADTTKSIKELQTEFNPLDIETEKSVEDVQKEQIQETTPKLKPAKSKKFRFKLLTVAYCLIFGLCVGWTIGNAIAINNQANLLTQTTDYVVSTKDVILGIMRLDDQNRPSDPSLDPSLHLIEDSITLTPEPLLTPDRYDTHTNWFDSICNWLSKLFRR